jgi:tetratricopeptide (TPR) repeat protein
MDLDQEAVASFRRVAASHPDSHYAIVAQLDLAELYRSWEQWREADEIYRTLRAINLPPAERTRATFGSAEVISRLGRPEDAYRIYRESEHAIREDASTLFRYAETAYRTGRYGQARNLFLTFFNIYSQDPLAPVAYAFVADTLRIDKRDRNAELAYDEILGRPAESLGEQLGLLMAIMGKRQLRGCATLPSPSDQAPCRVQDAPALNPLPVARALAVQAGDLIRERPSDPTLRRLIFNVATLLRTNGLVDDALELHYAIVSGLRPSPMRDRMSAILRESAESTVLIHVQAHDDLGVLRVFYRFRSAFPATAMGDKLGLLIAESHARLGLLAQAIELSGPIAANRPKYQAEEALFLLADSHRRRGELDRAQRRFGQYLTRYPGSSHGVEAILHLVDALGQQGQLQDAASRYEAWIARYGRQPTSAVVSRRLAGLIGDALYVDRRYPDAIRQYQTALADAATDEDRAWTQLQLGKSYAASGERAQGLAALKSVTAGPRDSLTARFAALHLQELEDAP